MSSGCKYTAHHVRLQACIGFEAAETLIQRIVQRCLLIDSSDQYVAFRKLTLAIGRDGQRKPTAVALIFLAQRDKKGTRHICAGIKVYELFPPGPFPRAGPLCAESIRANRRYLCSLIGAKLSLGAPDT
jgi:hypothetical protein